MPYEQGDSLAKVHGASKYTGKSKRAFIHAFNSCHKTGAEESRCFRIAHHAAQQAGGSKGKKGG